MRQPRSDILAGFGPNERALLERVPTRPLRRMAAAAVRTKERLQFTGWLQYMIPLGPTSVLALLAGLCTVAGLSTAGLVFGAATAVLLAIVVFDILTVKLQIRPAEARPARRDSLDAFGLMRARRSCRSFQRGLLGDEDRDALLATVRTHVAEPPLGPSPVRLEYVQARLTVWPTVNATEFLVAMVPQPYDRRSVIDVGRTLQKVVLEATRMGLGTCWIGPGADHASLKRHLGERYDPERDHIICVCAVGYPSRFVPLFIRIFGRMMGTRRPLTELFFTDSQLTTPLDVHAPAYASLEPCFEACRGAPSSYNGQTTRAVVRTSEPGHIVGVDFYSATTSRYYAAVALGIWCANWELGCAALGRTGTFDIAPPPSGDVVAPRHDVTWTPTGVADAAL